MNNFDAIPCLPAPTLVLGRRKEHRKSVFSYLLEIRRVTAGVEFLWREIIGADVFEESTIDQTRITLQVEKGMYGLISMRKSGIRYKI